MLFKTFIQLQKYCQISGKGNILAYEASLRMTETTHIVPVIGIELYNDLDAIVKDTDDENELDDQHKDLLHYCRMAIGPLFCFQHADKADVQLTDEGMKRTETQNSKTAYQEQRSKFKEANLREGETALELLIQYLEDHHDEYDGWTNSDNFIRYRSLFIKTGGEFNQFFPCQTPYRNFWAMRSKMQDVEENNVRPFLGDTLFDALKTKDALTNPGFTEKEKQLLFRIKKAIANFTVAFAAPLLNVAIIGNDVTVRAAASFSTNDNDNVRAGVKDNALSVYMRVCESTGTDWLNNAKKYLEANETDFENWIGFEEDETDDDCTNYNDGGGKGFF